MLESILDRPKYIIIISAILAAGMALFAPYLPLAPLLLVFLIFLWKYETKAFLFSLILLFLLTNSQNDKVIRSIVVIGGLASLTFLFLKKYGLNVSAYPRGPKPLAVYIIFITIFLFISSMFSENRMLCLGINVRQAVFFYICYTMYALIEDGKTIYTYLNGVMISGLIISFSILYEFYQYGFNLYYAKNDEFIRFGGIIDNINACGNIISVSIIITLIMLLLPKHKSFLYKAGYSFILIINIVGLFFTNSRASIISAVVGSIFILYVHNPAKFRKATLWFVAVVIFLLLTTELGNAVSVYFRVSTVFSVRDYLWQIHWNIIADHPVIGIGPEMSRFYFDRYFPVAMGTWEESEIRTLQSFQAPGMAHNFYLSYFAELGLPGLISTFLIIFAFGYIAKKLFNKLNQFDPNIKIVVIGITGLGVGLFFRSFFETMGIMTYGWIMNDISFWLCFISVVFIYQNPGKFELTENGLSYK